MIARYALIASLAANAALALAWGNARTGAAEASADLAACVDANGTHDAAVAAVSTRLALCTLDKSAARNAAREATTARLVAEHDLVRITTTERNTRNDLYESDLDCAAMARVPVCGPIADRLRARANDHPDADR